jgi:hypothetical protein
MIMDWYKTVPSKYLEMTEANGIQNYFYIFFRINFRK